MNAAQLAIKANLISFDQILHAATQDRDTGFCLACGCEHGNVEPDTQKRTCDACNARKVYGGEEIMFMLSL